MSSEYEFFSKDYIKFYMLNETVNSKAVSFKLFLESDGKEKDFLEVRTQGRNVYRFNNFNVSEDATNNCITFRPNVVGCYVYFSIGTQSAIRVEIIRNGTNTVAETFDLLAGTTKLDFHPQGTKKYDLELSYDSAVPEVSTPVQVNEPSGQGAVEPTINPFETDFSDFSANVHSAPSVSQTPVINTSQPDPFNPLSIHGGQSPVESGANILQVSVPQPVPTVSSFGSDSHMSEQKNEKQRAIDQLERSNDRLDDDISDLEKKIRELEDKNQQLIDKKKNLTSHLEKLQEEFDKDYSNFSADVEEINSKFNIDAEILKLYEDKEVTPIETLILNAENSIKEMEEQIRVFIEAQEKKTAEIESELKIGKKE